MTADATTRARVAELRAQVDHHARRYHEDDDPEIGDDAYDALVEELRALEAAHPELAADDSPARRVGGAPVPRLGKVEHLQPMLSLANVRDAQELRDWVGRMRNHLAREGLADVPFRYVCEPKVDGLAISLLYRDGTLERAATRGNGEIGEDVTHNVRTIAEVPVTLGPDAPPLVEVRGEIYMRVSDFTALNERRAAAGRSTFMNPRNSAAGTIRQLDPALAAERPLSLWAYGIGARDGLPHGGHEQDLDWLRSHGFPVNGDVVALDDEDAVIARCAWWQERRGALDFEIDGVVVKLDDHEQRRRLGAVGRDPRWAVAWKFPPSTAVTRLQRVIWNVGKYGDLHPFAVLEPVAVSGVTVKLATLHNEEDLARKDVRPGDDVIVLRAGDVIPQVVSPAPHVVERPGRAAPPRPPDACPSCGTAIVKPGAFSRCPNRACPARQWQLLKHFASQGAMDVEGLGERQVAQLQEAGLVASAADFYRLDVAALTALDGVGPVSAQRLVDAIAASRERPFSRVLYAIGIEGVGAVTGRNLAQRFRTIDALLHADPDAIAQTPGIGPVVAALIHEQLADPQMRALVADLRALGLVFEQAGAAPGEGTLDGRTVVLTGTLPTLTREEAAERILAAGGRVTSSVSGRTDALAAGDGAGAAKLEKAQRLGIPVIDEPTLLAVLAGDAPLPGRGGADDPPG